MSLMLQTVHARHPTLEVLALVPIELEPLLIPANQGLAWLQFKADGLMFLFSLCFMHLPFQYQFFEVIVQNKLPLASWGKGKSIFKNNNNKKH